MTVDQTSGDSAAAGMTAASRAIEALARNEEALALSCINSTTTHAEAAWMASYLLMAVRSAVVDLAGPARAPLLLQRFADNLAEDVITTRARLIVDEAERLT